MLARSCGTFPVALRCSTHLLVMWFTVDSLSNMYIQGSHLPPFSKSFDIYQTPAVGAVAGKSWWKHKRGNVARRNQWRWIHEDVFYFTANKLCAKTAVVLHCWILSQNCSTKGPQLIIPRLLMYFLWWYIFRAVQLELHCNYKAFIPWKSSWKSPIMFPDLNSS